MKKLGIIITLVFQLCDLYAPELSTDFRELRFNLISIRYSEFSEERLIWYLSQKPLPYKDIVLKQSKLETGNFTSKLFLENNNLFGMKNPVIRATTSKGSRNKHAYYEHWTYSVDDYVLWFHYNLHKLDNCYYTFLKRSRYAEDPHYISKLKRVR